MEIGLAKVWVSEAGLCSPIRRAGETEPRAVFVKGEYDVASRAVESPNW